jgi:putative DNA primase/helicase
MINSTEQLNGSKLCSPLDAARAYLRAGLSVIPIKRDGSKAPDGLLLPRVLRDDGKYHATWDPYKQRMPSEAEIDRWFRGTNGPGVGVIGGKVSRNLECIDFDTDAELIFPAWCDLVEAERLGLIGTLSISRTPKPGFHVRYRCPEFAIPGNEKLAEDPTAPPEKRTLIETRGEGGYALAPGCPAECHITGRLYEHYSGPKLSQVRDISGAEREILIRCARSFDRRPIEPEDTDTARGTSKVYAGISPGDDFNVRGWVWEQILTGWTRVGEAAGKVRWRRPGKEGPGWSATTGCKAKDGGHELLYVFSGNASPFEPEKAYSKFGAYALLHHAGDFSAAARELARLGFGSGSDGHNNRSARNPGPAATDEDWPDPKPIPNHLSPVQAFDYALLPKAFVSFVSDVAERMQCPADFPAVAVMVAFAGVVGKRIGICPKRHDDWLVVPNLWGAVIGRPGVMKTPAIRQPIKFLQRLEIEAKKEYAKELEAYEIKLLVAEDQKKQRKEAIAKALKDKQDPEKAAQAFIIEEPKKPVRKRFIVNDSTVEKLGELLNQNPNGLTVFRDEIAGLLEHLDREGQEGARAFYIEAWEGTGGFTYDRIGRGTIEIESTILSVLGGIQPGKLFGYLRGAIHGGAGDDGLMQRFQLAVYPDIDAKWRNIDRWPDTEAKQLVWAVFQSLNTLDPLTIGAESGDQGPFLRFDQQAQKLFDDWRSELEPRIRSGEEHPALESHLAKYRSLVPTLALVIHLADRVSGPVTATATRKALAWAQYLESHARRIYGLVTDPAPASAKALAKRIMDGDIPDGFTQRSVYRNAWAGLDKESTELAVDLLIEHGWLKAIETTTTGRPKVSYRIHPAILAKTRGKGTDKTDKSPSADPFGSFGSDLPGHSEPDWGEV